MVWVQYIIMLKIMQIGNLDDHYHFQLDDNLTLASEGCPSAKSKSFDHFSDISIGLRGEITRALSNSPKVYLIFIKIQLAV